MTEKTATEKTWCEKPIVMPPCLLLYHLRLQETAQSLLSWPHLGEDALLAWRALLLASAPCARGDGMLHRVRSCMRSNSWSTLSQWRTR